jgi:hypothetical protein
MLDSAVSVTGKRIRLTAERWSHITEQHCELAGWRDEVLETLSRPGRVLAGSEGERLAIREFAEGKWLVVVYREGNVDGFVITAFLTRRIRSLERRRLLWP